jgi:alkanesulfonate monooxygenase SsuD/methylene tetrahydromethanopterin reductase-like flavin-dependent oxidoreductase (luciferase family)
MTPPIPAGAATPTRARPRFSMRFTSTPRGAQLARRMVARRLAAWGWSPETDANQSMTLGRGRAGRERRPARPRARPRLPPHPHRDTDDAARRGDRHPRRAQAQAALESARRGTRPRPVPRLAARRPLGRDGTPGERARQDRLGRTRPIADRLTGPLDAVAAELRSRPRETLGWATPAERLFDLLAA